MQVALITKEIFYLKLDSIIGYKNINSWSYETRFLFIIEIIQNEVVKLN
jgi:hypothetical protein